MWSSGRRKRPRNAQLHTAQSSWTNLRNIGYQRRGILFSLHRTIGLCSSFGGQEKPLLSLLGQRHLKATTITITIIIIIIITLYHYKGEFCYDIHATSKQAGFYNLISSHDIIAATHCLCSFILRIRLPPPLHQQGCSWCEVTQPKLKGGEGMPMPNGLCRMPPMPICADVKRQ